METLIAIAVLGGVVYWAFKTGKREGSQKGYHVGRQHERKQVKRHRTGR
jgi:hypothetical protein